MFAGVQGQVCRRTLQPTRVGEVVIRGAAVTSGYWGDPNATARALDSEGWLRTGDLGWFDSWGRLMLCGRRKDMIKSGGENIHASEVESALAVVTGVQEVAVVGMPHLRFGEAVAALLCVHRCTADACGAPPTRQVSLNTSHGKGSMRGSEAKSIWEDVLGRKGMGGKSQEESLLDGNALAWLQGELKRGGLSGFKVPQTVAVSLLPLPRTATGKVDKRTVKSMLHKLTAQGGSVAAGGTWHRSAL